MKLDATAIAHHRPYRPANGLEKAIAELKKGVGVLYDSQVTETALKLLTDNNFSFQ